MADDKPVSNGSSAGTPSRDSEVTLREVTRDTVRQICNLRTSEYQRQFVAPNAVSIAQAYFDREIAWFRAVYAGDTPVGFVMLSDEPERGEYAIWRFMMDERYQRMGFGRKTMALVIEHVRTRPDAKELKLSYHRAEGGPQAFYLKMGFEDTDEMWDDEHVMRLSL